MLNTTYTEEASNVLRRAVQDEVIDTVLKPFNGFTIPYSMFDWVRSKPMSEPSNPHTFDLWQHPKSRRYQESIMEAQTQPDMAEYWAVELARIVVPHGQVGFVTGIEQVLNDVDGNYFPSNVAYWGSPTFSIDDVDNCRWYLTLDYFDGLLPPRFNLSQVAAIGAGRLPGFGYSDLPEIPGLWYPAHNGPANKVKLVIPGQRMLRFYFVTPPTLNYQWQASGRLRGYLQSTYSREAQANARMVF